MVSIHATLAGGDRASPAASPAYQRVSIHATLAGGDTIDAAQNPRACSVSIHATLAGGDFGLVHEPGRI